MLEKINISFARIIASLTAAAETRALFQYLRRVQSKAKAQIVMTLAVRKARLILLFHTAQHLFTLGHIRKISAVLVERRQPDRREEVDSTQIIIGQCCEGLCSPVPASPAHHRKLYKLY